jgi:restriction system protein
MKKIFLSYAYNQEAIDYASLIKSKLESHGMQVYDASSSNVGSDIINHLHNSINKCDLVIAFMMGSNLNVTYEVGYAIGKGKKVVIIANDFSEIPYNLKNILAISLQNDSDNKLNMLLSLVDNTESTKDELDSIGVKDLKYLLISYFEKTNEFDQIEPRKFEDFIFDWLNSEGFKVTRAGKKDIGYDFFISDYNKFTKTLVEVKKYNINNKVSIGMIQKFLDVLRYHKADHGIFISSSGFTQSATNFSGNTNPKIELWDMEYINELYQRRNGSLDLRT